MVDFAELFAFCDLHASRWAQRTQRQMNAFARGFLLHFPMYYDRQGFPIPGDDAAGIEAVIVWGRLREDATTNQVRVAYDELPDGSHLSTVWLGIDHQVGFGAPLIFETMRFTAEMHVVRLGNFEQECREEMDFPDIFGEPGETTSQLRYTTEEEALAAHHEIVRRLRIREGH